MEKQDNVAEVQLVQQGLEVGGERVVVVTDRGLAGVPEPTAVVGDHTLTGIEEHGDLLLPGVAVEGIAVDQHHGLPRAMVLVVELDGG
jgi:hypothetical protein